MNWFLTTYVITTWTTIAIWVGIFIHIFIAVANGTVQANPEASDDSVGYRILILVFVWLCPFINILLAIIIGWNLDKYLSGEYDNPPPKDKKQKSKKDIDKDTNEDKKEDNDDNNNLLQ